MTFESDWVGFLVYDDGDRLPLGRPNRVALQELTFTLYWPAKVADRDGTGVAIAVVTPTRAETVVTIDPVEVKRGWQFHGSLSIQLPGVLEWHDDRKGTP